MLRIPELEHLIFTIDHTQIILLVKKLSVANQRIDSRVHFAKNHRVSLESRLAVNILVQILQVVDITHQVRELSGLFVTPQLNIDQFIRIAIKIVRKSLLQRRESDNQDQPLKTHNFEPENRV